MQTDAGDTAPGRRRGPVSRARALLIAAAGLAVAVVLLAGATSLPAACASCHAMAPFASGLAKSPHADTHCYTCHLERGAWGLAGQKADEWLRMYPAAAVGVTTLPGPGSRVERAACLGCHAGVLGDVVAPGPVRIRHAECAGGQACDACHAGTAHGAATRLPRSPVMEECVVCHRRVAAPVLCDSCHTGKGERERLARGPWQITHGPAWKKTHGMGTLRYCATCHASGFCVTCHGTELPHPVEFGRTHGGEALKPRAACTDCHEQRFCDACHGLTMPHPGGFLRDHGGVAEGRDDPACARCHAETDCAGCHDRHTHPARSKSGTPLPRPKDGQ